MVIFSFRLLTMVVWRLLFLDMRGNATLLLRNFGSDSTLNSRKS